MIILRQKNYSNTERQRHIRSSIFGDKSFLLDGKFNEIKKIEGDGFTSRTVSKGSCAEGCFGRKWKDVYKQYLQNKDRYKERYPSFETPFTNKEVKDIIRKQAKRDLRTKVGGSALAVGAIAGGIALHKHLKKEKSEKGQEKDNNKKSKKK